MRGLVITAAIIAAAGATTANATNLIQNGNFTADGSTAAVSSTTSAAGQFIPNESLLLDSRSSAHTAYDVTIPGWSTVQDSQDQNAPFIFVQTATALGFSDGGTGFPDAWDNSHPTLHGSITAPPIGGPTVAVLDADYNVAPLYQVIPTSELVAGKTYTVSFDWAQTEWSQDDSNTTSSLEVAFGGTVVDVTGESTLTKGTWSGWETYTGTFEYEPGATSVPFGQDQQGAVPFTADNNWLTFLAIGSPINEPPTVLLSGVSLLTPAAVPEPATWALAILGVGMIGGAARRRRASLVAAG